MATKHYFKKGLGGVLVPTTEADREWLLSLPHDEVLSGAFSRPRNYKFHKKFFAMLGVIAHNSSYSVDDLLSVFKYRLGIGKWLKTRSGDIWQEGSISFAKMNQDEFSAFYQKAVNFVCEEIIPGLDAADLERELLEFAA